jgi:hypothetical protein
LKVNLTCHHFVTIDMSEAESQAELNILRAHDFQDALKNGRSAGNEAYLWNATSSSVMVASRPKVNFWPDDSISP